MKKAIVVVIIVLAIVNMGTCGYCQDAARKLTRGVANIVMSPFEIPKNIADTYYDTHAVHESILLGIPRGLGMMIQRIGVGAYETVTFPFPIPEGYRPVLEPEFMWDPSE